MTSQPRDMQLSVRNPELETVISTKSLPEQKSGRRRFDIHKNVESSRLYPNFTTRIPEPESRSTLFSHSSKPNFLYGPMNYILSQSTLPNKTSLLNPSPALLNPISKSPSNPRINSDPTNLKSNRDLKYHSQGPEPTLPLSTDEEIERLKYELFEKEEEIKKFRSLLPTSQQTELSSMVSKLELDKKQISERRKLNSMSLDMQISEKNEAKRQVKETKEKELVKRLELLRLMKEQQSREILNKLLRAKEYKEQLDVQKYVKDSIKVYSGKYIPKASPELASKLFEHQSPNPFKPSSSATLSPPPPKYTKKAQRTISHDPITGSFQDTSPFIFGPHPLITRRPQINTLN